jgi:predicted enzyme related to lactoylglutathione lyase
MFQTTPSFSGFSVNDIEVAKNFYGQVLGINVEQDSRGLLLKLANDTTVFVYPKPNHQPASFTILNFVVEDIDQAVNELIANGIVPEQYENLTDEKGIARGISINRGPDIAWFKDPAGNILSVLKES